ncbi:hypothetical protein [Pseudorhodoferax sp.]|uniref:hypothetical protein n=1 Tax=Pseudorhodoferax sp. TaxID=1993553 RepID=UPI002DD6BA64|nr:hypothetical protein [Pseudorhodoferax sp.]
MTPPRLFLQLPAALRRAVVALLLVALPLYGLGGALVQLLGPDHRHEAVAGTVHGGGWSELVGRQLQALVGPQTARLVENLRLQARLRPASAGHAHGAGAHHHHGLFERHHHGPHDASVVAVGARGDGQGGVDAATAGSMAMPLALAPGLRIPMAAARPVPWPPRTAVHWHSHVPALPERPPRA